MVYNLQQIEENTLTSIFIQQIISYFLLFLNKFRLKYQFTIIMQKSMKNSHQNSTKSLQMSTKLAEDMTVQEILEISGNFRQKLFVIWVVLIELC